MWKHSVIGAGRSSILPNEFKNHAGLYIVEIAEGVEFIGEGAFAGSPNLRCVIMPKSLKYICAGAFKDCARITKVILNDGLKGLFTVQVYDPAWSALPRFMKRTAEDGYGYREGKNGVFENCISLKDIELPRSITRIPDFTFAGCRKLKKVVVWGENIHVGKCAFKDCRSLCSIEFKGGMDCIDEAAFAGCKRLKAFELTGEVYVAGRAFWKCNALRSLIICKDATFGDSAFCDCPKLKDVKYPKQHHMGLYTFVNCSSDARRMADILARLMPGLPAGTMPDSLLHGAAMIIPEGVVEILPNAFKGVPGIREVVFPKSLRVIGDFAFGDCACLQKLSFGAGIEYIGAHAFWRTDIREMNMPDKVRERIHQTALPNYTQIASYL